MSLLRTRWAAVGAAVAVTLGAGGISLADAAKGSGDRPVTVTIEPCRLRDTRPDRGIGGRTGPLGPTEAYIVQGTGSSGNCDIPADATGLVLNVTADQATEATNLRLYPNGAAIPTTSNLNPRPGAAPTPNGVTVGLDNDGEFIVRNAKGNVHVIIDVTAYLVDHHHNDLYYTKAEADDRFVEADPSVVTPHLLSGVPDSGWSFAEGAWRSGPSTSCLMFPVESPDGGDVQRADLTYFSTGPRTITVRLTGLDRTPGPFTSETEIVTRHLADTVAAPASGGGVIAVVSITDDPSELPTLPVRSTIDNGTAVLEICTEQQTSILGVDIVFDS